MCYVARLEVGDTDVEVEVSGALVLTAALSVEAASEDLACAAVIHSPPLLGTSLGVAGDPLDALCL